MRRLMVCNWDKFQHYADRAPPWIKLYNNLLTNYEFSCLQDASKAHLLGIWLLASQLDNKIPNNAKWIGNRINATGKVDLKPLIAGGFLELEQDASIVLADRSQSACLETETETETEGETEVEVEVQQTARKTSLPPTWEIPDDWVVYAKERYPNVNCQREAERFHNHWTAQGATRKDWKATWRNWLMKAEEIGNGKPYREGAAERKPAHIRIAEAAGLEPIGQGGEGLGEYGTGIRRGLDTQ